MKYYETLFVIKPTFTEEEAAKVIEDVKSRLDEVEAVNHVGIRELAYPVQKFERGNYVIIYFKNNPEKINELEKFFKYNEDIIKFAIFKYETKKEIKKWQSDADKFKKD